MTDKHKNIVLRFGIVYFTIAFLFLAVIGKIIQIQVFERDEWLKLAETQRLDDIIVKPKRGNIFASDGRLLASSIPTYYLYMDSKADIFTLKEGKNFKDNLDSLSITLSAFFMDKKPDEFKRILIKAYNEGKRNLLLHPKRMTYDKVKEFNSIPFLKRKNLTRGFYKEEYVKRVKPFGSLASRTIGDVYADESKGGMSGIEGSFNDMLVGTPGISQRRKIANRYENIPEIEPIDGLDVYSTIDIEMQDIAEKALRDTIGEMGAQSGCIVVMEVQTGEIKAMVNLDFNEKTGTYFEGANHALTSRMEPGSTFKIASLIAVLDEGKVKINDVFDIEHGIFQIANRFMKDHNHNRGGYDKLHVNEIIQASSNVGTSKMVIKSFGDNPEKYVEKLYDLRLNDSLPLQMKGVARPWIKHPKKDKDLWYKTSLAWMSIGYETKMPPIYTLTLFNAIANNGKMVKPLFVKEIKRNEEVVNKYETEVLKESICKPSTLKDVQKTLIEVIEGKYATAKSAKSDIVRIAGKTGTAQISQGSLGYKVGQTRHNVSFCGYFPADAPQYSAIVLITAPNGPPSGGRMAGSVFKKLAERITLMKSHLTPEAMVNDSVHQYQFFPEVKAGSATAVNKIAKDLNLKVANAKGWVKQNNNSDSSIALDLYQRPNGLVPDVMGMGAKDAFFMLNSIGLNVRIKGKGKVIAQSLKPYTRLQDNSIIELELR
ncbi:penicillin-binding protein [Paludibacter sp.]